MDNTVNTRMDFIHEITLERVSEKPGEWPNEVGDKGTAKPSKPYCSAEVRLAMREKLKAAKEAFGPLPDLAEPPKISEPRHKDSWPLLEWINRTYGLDKAKRDKYIAAAHCVRDLLNTADMDPMAAAVHLPGKPSTSDFEVQRDEDGRVVYELGRTLDRKKKTFLEKDGEQDAERHSGSVRTAARAGPVSNSGFDVNRDDPFALRKIDAGFKLEDIAAESGRQAWNYTLPAFQENPDAQTVGMATGANNQGAAAIGTMFFRIVLDAAVEIMARDAAASAGTSLLTVLKTLPDGAAVPARRLKRALEMLEASQQPPADDGVNPKRHAAD